MLAAAGVAAALSVAPASAAPAPVEGLELVTVHTSLLGTHRWYRQTVAGHPVLDSYYVEHIDARTGRKTVDDGRVRVAALKPAVSVTGEAARAIAPGRARGAELVVLASGALAWSVISDDGHGSTRTLVDAGSGSVLDTTSLVQHVNGTGKVFSPNPVVTLQNVNLADSSPASAFTPAYKTVTLTQLDGSGALKGAWAANANPAASQVTSPTNTFSFTRNQPGFAQVMVYHHLTRAQEYIQSLGFTNVNAEPQDFVTTGLADDNSFYDPATDRITYGTGGVDDAEDADVIWHEYGHAIQDAQVPHFGGGGEAGAIGEGFGDYWAYSMSSAEQSDTAAAPLVCIADWDATSYSSAVPHCLRRTDAPKHYPENVAGEVHADGEMWSRALMTLNKGVGRVKADRIILEAQFGFTPHISFKDAANKTVATAYALYGLDGAVAATIAFKGRGFI